VALHPKAQGLWTKTQRNKKKQEEVRGRLLEWKSSFHSLSDVKSDRKEFNHLPWDYERCLLNAG